MDWAYDTRAAAGNVVQTARLPLTGIGRQAATRRSRSASAPTPAAAAATADAVARRRLRAPPPTATPRAGTTTSAASRGPRSVAGRERALRRLADGDGRARGQDLPRRRHRVAVDGVGLGHDPRLLGPYHLVWSRDLYQVASAQIAAGDRAAGGRALDYLWDAPAAGRRLLPAELEPRRLAALAEPAARRGRRPDPARLAARTLRRAHVELRRAAPRAASSSAGRPRRSAGRTPRATRRPRSPPRSPRWCVAARDRAAQRRGGRRRPLPRRRRRLAKARRAAGRARRNGPLSPRPVLPAPDRRRQRGRRHHLHDRRRRPDDRPAPRRGPELPRARAPRRQARRRPRRSSRRCPVVDRELGVDTPNGQFWHRYNHDGYGETRGRRAVPGPRQPRPPVADLRRRARRVRARRRRPGPRRRARPRWLDASPPPRARA